MTCSFDWYFSKHFQIILIEHPDPGLGPARDIEFPCARYTRNVIRLWFERYVACVTGGNIDRAQSISTLAAHKEGAVIV
jgi:hypothetical protein